MKFTIEIEAHHFGDVSALVRARQEVAKHAKKIWSSTKSRKQLLQLFNDDFDEFVSFVCSAERLSTALKHIAMVNLDSDPK